MKFQQATKDERDEWRRMPMSQAALELLREFRDDYARATISAATGSDEREVRIAAGTYRGLTLALELLSEAK